MLFGKLPNSNTLLVYFVDFEMHDFMYYIIYTTNLIYYMN